MISVDERGNVRLIMVSISSIEVNYGHITLSWNYAFKKNHLKWFFDVKRSFHWKKKKEGFYCWKSEKIFLYPFILKDEDINLSLNISLVFEKGYFKKDHLMSFWGKRLLGSKTLGTNVLKLQFVYVSKPWSKHLV